MGSEYISSFNSGELSEYLEARVDITDKYKNGCRSLENMYVLPQGGVERRAGTRYVASTISDNVRLFPFSFAEDDSYVIEFGDGLFRVYNDAGYTGVEEPHPYTPEEINLLKFKRVFDVMYLTCPTKPVHQIRRTSLTPLVFELVALDFAYPPLLEENTEVETLIGAQPLPWIPATEFPIGSQVQSSGLYYTCNTLHTSSPEFATDASFWTTLYQNGIYVATGDEIMLKSTTPVFNIDMEGAYFVLRHDRTESRTADAGILSSNNQTSKSIFVGNLRYTITITNKYVRQGRTGAWSNCVIEESLDGGGSWTNIKSYSDRKSSTWTNHGLPAPANSIVRVRKTNGDATTVYSLGSQTNRRVTSDGAIDVDHVSMPLDVSFSNWTATTGGVNWTGVVVLEKSIDDQDTWNVETTIGDTFGVDTRNFTVSSPGKEQGNTWIRIKYTQYSNNDFTYSIVNDSLKSEGIVRLDSYVDDQNFKATIINSLGSPAPTRYWSEGAFSNHRGFPNAIELYEERMTYSGTFNDPSTIWMSVVGDYENFQLGPNDDEALKYIPATPEATQWLLSKKSLHQGTIGGIVNNYSVNKDTVITPSTIKASDETAYGCQNVQAIFANDVSIYVQRLGKKLRELVYNWEEDKFDSNDLNILASHITDGGITDITVQKTPDQIVWCLTVEGTLAALTYERSEGVAGWHRHNFGGVVKSIAVRPSSGEDELWIAVERDGGTYIERSESRTFSDDMLDAWYVDSGVKKVLVGNQTADSFELDLYGKIIINKVSHGLIDGDNIRMSNMKGLEDLNDMVYTVSDSTLDSFILQSTSDAYMDWSLMSRPARVGVNGAGSPVNYTYVYSDERDRWEVGYIPAERELFIEKTVDGSWILNAVGYPTLYYTKDTKLVPPLYNWEVGTDPEPAPTLTYLYDGDAIGGDFIQVSNTWPNFDHLEGEVLQAQGDGGYAGEFTVVSGDIVTDAYYNQIIAGKAYVSVVQPMLIEAAKFENPVGVRKNIQSLVIRFVRTVGAVTGVINVNSNGSVPKIDADNTEQIIFRKTMNALGIPLEPFTGDKLVYTNDSWERLKGVYVMQNIPMPMTVVGMSIKIKTGREV